MHGWLEERRQRSLQIARHLSATIEPGQFDLPTVEAVKQRAFETVLNPQANPGLLKTLLSTVLKMQDQQLAREKLDLATAKTIQADRIAQIEAVGGDPLPNPHHPNRDHPQRTGRQTRRSAHTETGPCAPADPGRHFRSNSHSTTRAPEPHHSTYPLTGGIQTGVRPRLTDSRPRPSTLRALETHRRSRRLF